MVLTVAVLGAVKARRDGDRLSVPAGKTTELLVRLALDAGSRVRVDILLEDVWPTSAGRNTLQSKVSQLRRALGDKDLAAETDDRDSLEEVLTLARADENHVVTILALDGLARLSADECEPERAAELVARRTPSSPRSLICSTTQTCPTARQRVVSAHEHSEPGRHPDPCGSRTGRRRPSRPRTPRALRSLGEQRTWPRGRTRFGLSERPRR